MRGSTIASLLIAITLLGCGGSGDGFVELFSTDTEGTEWVISASAEDGKWTGCIHYEEPGTTVEEEHCAPPRGFVEYVGGDVLRFGAVPKGTRLEGVEDGRVVDRKISTFGNDAIGDYRFFGVIVDLEVRPVPDTT